MEKMGLEKRGQVKGLCAQILYPAGDKDHGNGSMYVLEHSP